MTTDAATGAPAAPTTAAATYFADIAGPAGTPGAPAAGGAEADENFSADEAVAEIERLRADNAKWTALSRKHEAENKRLKKEKGGTPDAATTATGQTGGAPAADAGRQATIDAENERLRQENLRLRVASVKGLPANLVDRLRGDDEEEMMADADELLKMVRAPRFQGGADGHAGGGSSKPPTFGDQIRDALKSGRTTISS